MLTNLVMQWKKNIWLDSLLCVPGFLPIPTLQILEHRRSGPSPCDMGGRLSWSWISWICLANLERLQNCLFHIVKLLDADEQNRWLIRLIFPLGDWFLCFQTSLNVEKYYVGPSATVPICFRFSASATRLSHFWYIFLCTNNLLLARNYGKFLVLFLTFFSYTTSALEHLFFESDVLWQNEPYLYLKREYPPASGNICQSPEHFTSMGVSEYTIRWKLRDVSSFLHCSQKGGGSH